MSSLVQTILAAVGASGIVGLITTLIVTRVIQKSFDRQDRREKLRDENQFLMMKRLDNVADMTHLMANKLHEAGTINGDLEELDNKYKELNDEYSENIRRLAFEVLHGK